MSGTIIGGNKAAITVKRRYGDKFFQVIGQIGGSRKGYELRSPKGFAAMKPERRRELGKIGGTISRRGRTKAVIGPQLTYDELANI